MVKVHVWMPNLNEDSILYFIASIQNNIPRYQLAKNNCSHIVAMALIQGAKQKPTFTHHMPDITAVLVVYWDEVYGHRTKS
jgi:hypothetical protein